MTDRVARKIREAHALKDAEPTETLAMGFSAVRFGQRLSEAADVARA